MALTLNPIRPTALQSLAPLRAPQSRPLPVNPLALPGFGRDSLQRLATGSVPATLPALAALSEGPSVARAMALEKAKLEGEPLEMSQLPDFSVTPMRIGLDTAQTRARFSLTQGALWVDGPEGRKPLLADAQGDFEVQAIEGGFVLKRDGQSLGAQLGKLIVENQSPTISINGQNYRGSLELMPNPANPSTFQVVNPVLLEDYLLSVVPSESPASWPLESLKAQALAARTYAVANWGKHGAEGFDMSDDTSDQMYKGVVSETPASSEAAKATAGKVMTYANRPINALFFSCSGGMTDSAAEVWNVELPYIQPVVDYDQAAPRYKWNVGKSQADLQAAAKKLGAEVGTVKDIKVLTTTPQGRVKTMRLIGTAGIADVDGNAFRFAAGLNSTLWKLTVSGSGNARQFSFSGGGWGHGLGMSQYGARQMAADGKAAEEIVKHYYQGIEIQDLKPAS